MRKPPTAVVGPVERSYYTIEQTVHSAVISSPPYGSPQSPSDRPQFLQARRVTDGILNATGTVSNAQNSFGATSAGDWLALFRKHQKGGQSTALSACGWLKKGQ
jgi:predicted RNA methylase